MSRGLSPVSAMKGANTQTFVLEKYLAIPGLVLTTIVSTTLLATSLEDRTSSPGFADFVVANRPAVGIFVQVVSHLFGLLQLSALRNVINLSSRVFLLHKTFSLDLIGFLNALCGQRLDWSLRWHHRLVLIAYLTIAIIPAALWAGALTPVVSNKQMVQTILLPGYSNTTLLAGVPYHSNLRNIYNIHTAKGLFSYEPEFDMQGSMLFQAADASSQIGNTTNHTKLDKTNYVYQGRSYGVGSSVGLTDDMLRESTEGYEYYELGFQAETSCFYNSTADFSLSQSLSPDGWTMEIYEAVGTTPFGDGINFATMGFNPAGVVALFTATKGTQHVLMVTTGANGTDYYARLQNVQCGITFTSTNYSIVVDTNQRLISISPQGSAPWPSYGNMSVDAAVRSISTMGQILATSPFVSILGQSLIYNIANVEANQGLSESSNLKGIADAVNSLLDNILLAYGSAQLMVGKEGNETPVDTRVRAVTFGSRAYTIPIFILNMIICLIYAVEMLRTRRWLHLSNFDFMVVRSLMVGTSLAGTALADKSRMLHDTHPLAWKTDGGARLVGDIQLKLDRRSYDDVAIVLANQQDDVTADPFAAGHTDDTDQTQPHVGSFLLEELNSQKRPAADVRTVESESSLLGSFQ